MPLKLRCTSCNRSLRVPRLQAGQTVRCPSCGAKVAVPAESPDDVAPGETSENAAPALKKQAGSGPSLVTPPQPGSTPNPPPTTKPPPLPKVEPAGLTPPRNLPPPTIESIPPPPPLPPPRPDAAPFGTPAAAVPPPMHPPPAAPPEPTPTKLPGVEHAWLRRWPVYQFGMWVIAVAIVGVIPALLDIIGHASHADAVWISRWALLLLLTSGLQIAYAVYLMQLPDWGTAWVTSVVMLLYAAGYAAMLGMLTLANQQSQIVQFLELGDKLPGHQATTWCLAMLTVSGLLAYFSGRISFRWRRTYWRWATSAK